MAIKTATLKEFTPYQMAGPYKVWSIGNPAHPPVLLMHEIPSLSDEVLGLAKKLSQEAFFVVVPSLIGTPGKRGMLRQVASGFRVCFMKEFSALAKEKSGTLVTWLQTVCRQLHDQHLKKDPNARGVGVIGLCVTGNFALTLMMDGDAKVVAPIMSEPSLPLPFGSARKAAIHISPTELAAVKDRLIQDDLTVLGLRFKRDWICPHDRFETLKCEFGDRFDDVELCRLAGDRNRPHSVLTLDFSDAAGHPTQAAYAKVVALLNLRLK